MYLKISVNYSSSFSPPSDFLLTTAFEEGASSPFSSFFSFAIVVVAIVEGEGEEEGKDFPTTPTLASGGEGLRPRSRSSSFHSPSPSLRRRDVHRSPPSPLLDVSTPSAHHIVGSRAGEAPRLEAFNGGGGGSWLAGRVALSLAEV
jgi:hypothetical protein